METYPGVSVLAGAALDTAHLGNGCDVLSIDEMHDDILEEVLFLMTDEWLLGSASRHRCG